MCAVIVGSNSWLIRARQLQNAETADYNASQFEILDIHHDLAMTFVAEYQTALLVDSRALTPADLEAASSLRRSTAARFRPDLLRLAASEDSYISSVATEMLMIIDEYEDRAIESVADQFFIEAKTDELINAVYQPVEAAGPKIRRFRDLGVKTLSFGSIVTEIAVLGDVKSEYVSTSPLIDLVEGRYRNAVSRLDAPPTFVDESEFVESDLDPATLELFSVLDRSSTVATLNIEYRWWRDRAMAGDPPLRSDDLVSSIVSFNALEAAFFDDALAIERGNLEGGAEDALASARKHLIIAAFALFLGVVNLLVTLVVRLGREDRLRTEIESDPLTGLGSRALFPVVEELLQAQGTHTRALLHIDLDRFKPVNDTFGHQVGDELLVQIGGILRTAIRNDKDIPLRVGGDEFLLILDEIESVNEAERVGERLRTEIGRSFRISGHEINVGASIGVATSSEPTSLDSLLTEADLALYEAKNNGRGRLVVFERSAQRTFVRELPDRLQSGDFDVDLRSHLSMHAGHQETGVDLVLSWRDDEHGQISTEDLRSMIEWSGHSREYARCQLAAVAAHQTEMPSISVWLTTTSDLLRSPRAAQNFVADALAANVDLRRLGVVLSDVSLTEGFDVAAATLAVLRTRGVKLALGGFGMDRSPLRALVELPFEQVRVDCDLLRSAVHDTSREVLVSAIVDICDNLGIRAVATHGVTDVVVESVDLRAPIA